MSRRTYSGEEVRKVLVKSDRTHRDAGTQDRGTERPQASETLRDETRVSRRAQSRFHRQLHLTIGGQRCMVNYNQSGYAKNELKKYVSQLCGGSHDKSDKNHVAGSDCETVAMKPNTLATSPNEKAANASVRNPRAATTDVVR